MLKFSLFFVLVFSLTSHAANDGGLGEGGGNAVVCSDGTRAYAELLDYAEARQLRDSVLNLGAPELAVNEKVALALHRLERVDPVKAAYFAQRAAEFFPAAQLVPGAELTPIPDSNHLIMPKHCVLKQLAIRREPKHPGDKRFILSKDIWDLMNNDQRAGLVLHEIIYDDLHERLNQTDSSNARYFNALLASTAFAALSFHDYVEAIQSMGNTQIMVGSISVLLAGMTFDRDGWLQSAMTRAGTMRLQGRDWEISWGSQTKFYRTGVPEFMRFYYDSNKQWRGLPLDFEFAGNHVILDLSRGLGFYANGQIASGQPHRDSYDTMIGRKPVPLYFQTDLNKFKLEAASSVPMEFYPSGKLKTASLPHNEYPEVTCVDGSKKKPRSYYGDPIVLRLAEDGRVQNCEQLKE